MVSKIKIKKRAFGVGAGLGFLLMMASASQAVTHTVQFGGSLGLTYSPSSFTAKVGDTVMWSGDFTMHPLSSTTIPATASSWHNASGSSFVYVIKVAGDYHYQCDTHVSAGMIGSFSATAAVAATIAANKTTEAFSMTATAQNGAAALRFTMPHSGMVSLHVVDLSGKDILSEERIFNRGFSEILLPNLSKGVYFVRAVFSGKETVNSFSVIR